MIDINTLNFSYRLRAEYSSPIQNHSFSVMFLPADSARQRVNRLGIEIIPSCTKYCTTADNFKNKKLYGTIAEPHNSFEVNISGTVITGLDIYEEYTLNPVEYALLKTHTELTQPGKSLIEYHKNLELERLSGSYDKALHIMHTLYLTFRYIQGATVIHETAENALSIGKGVCQDYAHIMIALLRMENIPARYVVGMMLGEGSSHAWVEVLCNGYWYGFDPTNNKLVNDEYIRVSCGRDSNDCSVIRGKFYGMTSQLQTESVSVEKA